MADQMQHQYYQRPGDRAKEGIKSILPDRGPSTAQIIALMTLLPLGGTLLALSGVTLAATLIGLAVATPVFVICSPVLVPAALIVGFGVAGFLTSGAFGVTALSSVSWMVGHLRKIQHALPHQLDHMKGRAQETAGFFGQKAREAGQNVQQKAQDVTRGAQDVGRT